MQCSHMYIPLTCRVMDAARRTTIERAAWFGSTLVSLSLNLRPSIAQAQFLPLSLPGSMLPWRYRVQWTDS